MGRCRPVASALLLALGFSLSAFPAVLYQVSVDTSTLSGSGIVEMQFNPGMVTSQAATAAVSMASGVLLGSVEPSIGDVSGDLSGVVNFGNTTALNDFAQNVTFGSLFQFY